MLSQRRGIAAVGQETCYWHDGEKGQEFEQQSTLLMFLISRYQLLLLVLLFYPAHLGILCC
jgi:hypothetical protein